MSSNDVNFRIPGKYTSGSGSSSSPTSVPTPPLDWLHNKWTVTHSTLKRWRTAQNLSITYGPLPGSADGRARVSDTVAYQATGKGKKSRVKTICGVDTVADDTTVWDWRGSGLLKPISCRWEILGWGERRGGGGEGATSVKEKWVVTWFAPTMFTEEGVDVYCDREGGMSEELADLVRKGLEGLEAKELAELVRANLMPVAICPEDLPTTQAEG